MIAMTASTTPYAAPPKTAPFTDDHATRRRMAKVHPDAIDLAERLASHQRLPTRIAGARTSNDKTVFEVEINGRMHLLTLQTIR
jgi:hypothetical protein